MTASDSTGLTTLVPNEYSRGRSVCGDAVSGLQALGYRSVVIYRAGMSQPLAHPGEPSLRGLLGPPVGEDDLARVYTLDEAGG